MASTRSSFRFLPLLLIIAAATRGLAQYQYDYGYTDTYDDFYDTEEETSYDEYGYYENEDEAYYEYYGESLHPLIRASRPCGLASLLLILIIGNGLCRMYPFWLVTI